MSQRSAFGGAQRFGAFTALVVLAACAPKRVNEPPVLRNGDRVYAPDAVVESARDDAFRTGAEAAERSDVLASEGFDTCAPAVCAAMARGEVALGMTAAQVMTATGTTDAAWRYRTAGDDAAVMVPASLVHTPRDAVAEIALVQMRAGRVASFSYLEGPGVRAVAQQVDATTTGRAASLAELLLREGDDYVARGDLARALDRYDRAQILRPGDAIIDYRIATVLDKQLRPVEALMRYRRFLHELELERIGAVGAAYAQLAEAMAYARQRVLILEREAR